MTELIVAERPGSVKFAAKRKYLSLNSRGPATPLLIQAELSKLVLKEGTEKGLSLCIRSAKRPSFAIKEEESAP